MNLDAFDFDLPEALIALRPVEPQDASRLLVIHGDGRLEDSHMLNLPQHLRAGDVMVFNDTRVLPAALKGVRPARDANGRDVACDVNLVEPLSDGVWRALARPGKRLKVGDALRFAEGFTAQLVAKHDDGEVDLDFSMSGDGLRQALEAHGAMPLPPYIARKRPADASDRATYQTQFAGDDAQSVAAPTAGLHFTDRLLQRIDAAEITRETVRLHVGLGTFAPLKPHQLDDKKLHEEWRHISVETADNLNAARRENRRIIPVGTTAMRTLESTADTAGVFHPASGPTDIFLKPGDAINGTDALITNFHLPRSSLFMLVSALIGTEIMQAAYAHAIAHKYRFYSYGDACLLLP